MNEQAAKLTRWLLAGNGALKNIAQLVIDAFGPAGVAAAAIDASTITAYPTDPGTHPQGNGWTPVDNGWAHPLHSQLLPHSTTASHHVLAGITSRNELLIINLAAAAYVGIEGHDPIPLMRSWLMQVLAKTPTANVVVTDPALAIAGAERLTLLGKAADVPPDTSIIFSTQHTRVPSAPAAITVSSQAAGAANVVLCSEAVAGVYLANRYWPIWRRVELSPQPWARLTAALGTSPPHLVTAPQPLPPATPLPPLTAPPLATPRPPATPTAAPPAAGEPAILFLSAETDDLPPSPPPPSGAATAIQFLAAEPEPAAPVEDEPPPQDAFASAIAVGDPSPPPPALHALAATPGAFDSHDNTDHPSVADTATSTADSPAAAEESRLGLYVLGHTYALGADPDTHEPIKHSAVTRQGVRKPVKALMALATSSGVTTAEWEEGILRVTPSNRRQLRTQIRKMMGGNDPVRIDARGLLVVDMFCDWKEFKRLTGNTPETASTEDLTAAVQLIRGAPFEGVPDGELSWRSVQLLKDQLIDECSSAAVELARRQHQAGATTAAHHTARRGLHVYTQREDLWLIAARTVSDADRPGLIWDLKRAIPVPTHPELRQLISAPRAS